jgi:hypothetical protein
LLVFLFVFAVALGIVIGRYSAVSQSPALPQKMGASAFAPGSLEVPSDRLHPMC